MRSAFEIVGFFALAISAHVAGAAALVHSGMLPLRASTPPEPSVTLAAVPPAVLRQLEAWDAQPVVGSAPRATKAPGASLAPDLPTRMPGATALPEPMPKLGAHTADQPAAPAEALPPRPRIAPVPLLAAAPNAAQAPDIGSTRLSRFSAPRGALAPAIPSLNDARPLRLEPEPPEITLAARAALTATWRDEVLRLVDLEAPFVAMVAARGGARLRLTVSSEGKLLDLGLVKSSGDDLLDRVAFASVHGLARFPAAPEGLALDKLIVDLPSERSATLP